MIYVLDACAVIAYVRNEPGRTAVENILLESTNIVYMHAINACEVYYDFAKTNGQTIARNVIEDSIRAGVIIDESTDSALWQAAGDLKAQNKISLADAFALALAKRLDAALVTSDHKEFDPLVGKGICDFEFIR